MVVNHYHLWGEDALNFGNFTVYLGCLTCNQYASDSVHYKYGLYGGQYSATSIWYDYGQYGSTYSNRSVCYSYASSPPRVYDDNGAYYGEMTVNNFRSQQIEEYVPWLTSAAYDPFNLSIGPVCN